MSQDEQVEQTMQDEHVLQKWGITQARRLSRNMYIVFVIVTVATVVGAAAYMAFADESLVKLNTMGFWLVVLFALVLFGLRFVQLNKQREDVTAFIAHLKRNLTGDPEHDVKAQAEAEASFDWKSRQIMIVIRMIALAMIVLVMVNTYKGGVVDLWRQFVFDGCIAIVIAGFAWDQFTFRAELLESELRARATAAARYQSTPEYKERMRQQREAEEAQRVEQAQLAEALAAEQAQPAEAAEQAQPTGAAEQAQLAEVLAAKQAQPTEAAEQAQLDDASDAEQAGNVSSAPDESDESDESEL